jgi:hypothetical protein
MQEWLREHPTSWSGMPYCAAIGRTKLFTDENIRWIARAIDDQKAERKEHNEAAKNDDGFIYFIELVTSSKSVTRDHRSRAALR